MKIEDMIPEGWKLIELYSLGEDMHQPSKYIASLWRANCGGIQSGYGWNPTEALNAACKLASLMNIKIAAKEFS